MTRPGTTEAELRRITAHHEAGHAVATYVGGGTVHSISIEPTAETLGQTVMSPRDGTGAAFAIHGGPFAEARSQWLLSTFDLSDHYHHELFERMVWKAWMLNLHGNGVPSDGDLMQMANQTEEADGLMVVFNYRRDQWDILLETLWEAIQEVADLLLRGDTIAQTEVAEIVERRNPGARERGLN